MKVASENHLKVAPAPGTASKAVWALPLVVLLSTMVQFPFHVRPFFGNYASYQILMGMMAKMMVWENFSGLLYPKTFCILDGNPSLHLVYYPIASLVAALGHRFLGGSLEGWGRLQSVIFTQASVGVLYLFVRRVFTRRTALAAAACFAFSPMVLIYGQSFQNEACAAFFLVLAFYLLARSQRVPVVLFSAVSFSLSVLARHHFLFCLPALLCFLWTQAPPRSFAKCVLYCTATLLLPALWLAFVYHLSQTRHDIYTHPFIQFAVGKTFPHPLLLNPEFYKRLLREGVELYFNPLGFSLLVLSLALDHGRRGLFCVVWFWSVVGLFLMVPVKIFDHHFYAYPLLPAGAILMAQAVEHIFFEGRALRQFFAPRWLSAGLVVIVAAALSISRAAPSIFMHERSDDLVLAASAFLKSHTREDARVVDGYKGQMLTLYYADRMGWPFDMRSEREIPPAWAAARLQNVGEEARRERNEAYRSPETWLEYLRKQGAQVFMAADRKELEGTPEFFQYLKDRYRLLSGPSDPFIAFDLAWSGKAA